MLPSVTLGALQESLCCSFGRSTSTLKADLLVGDKVYEELGQAPFASEPTKGEIVALVVFTVRSQVIDGASGACGRQEAVLHDERVWEEALAREAAGGEAGSLACELYVVASNS